MERKIKTEETGRKVLPTGLHLLDARLKGGILSGSTVAFISDPLAMPEIFLYKFCQERKTVYVNTERRPKYILEDMEKLGIDPSELRFIDLYSQHFMDSKGSFITSGGYKDRKTIEFMEESLRKINTEEKKINLIIDSFSFFKELDIDKKRILTILKFLYEVGKNLNGLTFLLSNKPSNTLEYNSDVVLKAKTVEQNDLSKKKLFIPKVRGGNPPEKAIEYEVDIEKGIKVKTGKKV